MSKKYDVIIIGAGAAGMICAAEATARGLKTIILEHNAAALRKVAFRAAENAILLILKRITNIMPQKTRSL